MASFKKRRKTSGAISIHACVKCAGQKTQYASFPNLAEARRWAAKTESDLRQYKLQLAFPADLHTAGEAIGRYLDKVLPSKSKKINFVKQRQAQLLWWNKRIGNYTLSALSPSLLCACRDDLAATRSPATVQSYFSALSHVFAIAMREWEWLETSPLLRVRMPKLPRGRVRFLTDIERSALLDACRRERRKPLYLIVLLAISTGARKQELLSLQWKDVDLGRHQITLQETKNGERRAMFVYGKAHVFLEKHQRLIRSRYVFPNRSGQRPVDIEREFRRACQRAGLSDFHFHDLRHTAASYLAMNGATPNEIAEVLGHKSLNMVKRYAHLSATHTAAVVAGMNEKIFGGGDVG